MNRTRCWQPHAAGLHLLPYPAGPDADVALWHLKLSSATPAQPMFLLHRPSPPGNPACTPVCMPPVRACSPAPPLTEDANPFGLKRMDWSQVKDLEVTTDRCRAWQQERWRHCHRTYVYVHRPAVPCVVHCCASHLSTGICTVAADACLQSACCSSYVAKDRCCLVVKLRTTSCPAQCTLFAGGAFASLPPNTHCHHTLVSVTAGLLCL